MTKNFYPKSLFLLALAGSFSSMGVTANDGTITFTGEVVDATCIITGGDETRPDQGADFNVSLPQISVTALASAGQAAGDTPFHINLTGENCPNGKTANVVFERAQSTNIDSTTGYLKNTEATGGAQNVQVRILNNDKTPLNLTLANSSHQPQVIASNKASFKYWGQYIAVNGAAKAGTVKSDVVYSITYN